MVTNEPDKIREVWSSGTVSYELHHRLVVNTVHIESEGAHCNANHALRVVEELDGLRVQWEVIGVLWWVNACYMLK